MACDVVFLQLCCLHHQLSLQFQLNHLLVELCLLLFYLVPQFIVLLLKHLLVELQLLVGVKKLLALLLIAVLKLFLKLNNFLTQTVANLGNISPSKLCLLLDLFVSESALF